MNVPLKKRYNYCTINNGNIGAVNVNAKPATINNATIYTEMLFKSRENNNENAEQTMRIDIGVAGGGIGSGVTVNKLEPEKKINAAICTLSTAIMPTAVKGIQSVRVQQHYVQYTGDVVDPIQQPPLRCSIDDNQVHSNIVAKTNPPPPSAISSSSAVITSSASNHSFALSEQNDEKSSSQCSRKIACAATGAHKTDGSGSSITVVRHTNKYLTENSIRMIELRNPGMTTQERVLNWKIADEFSDVEDDFDESRYTQSQPFRSERLQKRIYKKPVQATSSSASSSTASFAKPSFGLKSREAPPKKYKTTASKINETLTSGSGSSSDVGERPLLQKMLAKKLWSKNSNHLRKRQLMPLKVQVPVPSTPQAAKTAAPAVATEAPTAIKLLRIDYTKKQTQSSTGNFKVPVVPSDKIGSDAQTAIRHKHVARSQTPIKNLNSAIHSIESATDGSARLQDSGDDRASSSSNEVAEISKTRNTREEFYKYLGIDTNPCHEKLSPGSSTGDTNSSSQMRRSLRVKIQQNIVNKLAKSKSEVRDGSNDKNGANITPTSSNASCSPPLQPSEKEKTSRMVPTHSPLKRTASPNIREESSKLLKISYMKDDGKKVGAEPIVYKSICLMNQTIDQMKKTKLKETLVNSTPAHVFERRSYEIGSLAENESVSSAKTTCAYTVKVLTSASVTDQRQSSEKMSQVVTKETECTSSSVKKETVDDSDHDEKVSKCAIPTNDSMVVDGTADTSNCRTSDRAETKRRHLIRKVINFTEMFKRYKRCLRQGIALKSQLQQTIRRRPPQRLSTKAVEKSTNSSIRSASQLMQGQTVESDSAATADQVIAKVGHHTDDDEQDVAIHLHNVIENKADLPADVIATIIGLPSTSTKPQTAVASTSYEDVTFSPTSMTHSNASTDSAIVVSNTGNDCASSAPILVNAAGQTTTVRTSEPVASSKCHIEQMSSSTKPTMKNPLNPINGCVRAISIHPITAHVQCVVVIQETTVSFWRMSSNVLSIFGVSPAWELIGEIKRLTNDTELVSMHQTRVIGEADQYPVYVELRSRESPPNDTRQVYLSFVYANIYTLRRATNGERQLSVESVNLDSIKGVTASINFIGLRNSSNIMMSWTEQTVTRTRGGLCKYHFKVPDYDSVESILDFAYLQHSIKSLSQLTGDDNGNQVVGCGDRIVSVWDHRNGNLLMNFEIDLPSIGTNLGCLCINYESAEYMLLVQLSENINNSKYQQLKLIAVHTTNSFSWRTLHTHNLPNRFGRIQSTQIGNDTLIITFTNGNTLLLNLFTPQIIYFREETNTIFAKNYSTNSKTTIKNCNCDDEVNDDSLMNTSTGNRVFVQTNGQIVHVSSDHITTKSAWEYFIQKDDK